MKRKIIALCVVIAMMAVAIAGSTMAYFTDTDHAVNVMVLGNIDVEQHELQRAPGVAHNYDYASVAAGTLVPFEQDKEFMPAVPKSDDEPYYAERTDLFYWNDYVTADVAAGPSGNGLWNDSKLANVLDKMIFVENTGKSECYYRTIIALECPEGAEFSEIPDKEFMFNINGGNRFDWRKYDLYTSINGTRYLILVATYLPVLEPGTISRPSLLQVVMTHHATNETAELVGDTYEILAITQAVQAKGFEDAKTALNESFGEVTAANVQTWFN